MKTNILQMKRALCAALLVLLLSVVGMTKSYADNYDFSAVCSTGQTLYYKITDATNHHVMLTYPSSDPTNPWQGYYEPEGNIILPSAVSYNGISYTVTEIGPCVFNGDLGLISITIPNAISSVGDGAFSRCFHLKTVCFTGSIEQWCNITFSSPGAQPLCYADLYINNSLVRNLTIPSTVTEIKPYAFYNANLTSLTLSNSVTSIGDGAFQSCSGLTSLTIPNSVTFIGDYAFAGCGGEVVYYNAVNCTDCNGNMPCFHNCTGTLVIGNDVERIPAGMFSGADFTGPLTIPNSVTTIGSFAFRGCSGFRGSLTIPDSVTTIGSNAFDYCSGFTGNLTIGNSVTTIGLCAFYGCSGFTGSLTIGNSVDTIGVYAFYKCSGFTGSLTIPNSVTTIGSYAFGHCSGFTGNLTIGDSVTDIGTAAFAYCDGLTGVNYTGNLAQWCSISFAGRDNPLTYAHNLYINNELLTDLYIPEIVTAIKAYSFQGATCLTSLTITNSVTSIGAEAFYGCSNLDTIIALGTEPPTLEYDVFSDFFTLIVPCGCQEVYQSSWDISYTRIHEDCNEYLIEINTIGVGGNVSSSTTEAAMGEEVQLSVAPDSGMALSSLIVCNATNPSQTISVYPIGKASSLYGFIMPPFAVSVSATFVPGTSVGENHSISIPANVYPNPTNGQVTIKAEGLKQITISNILGQIVYESKANGDAFEYDFGKHDVGVYVVRIETANGVLVKKVSVTR